MPMTRYQKFMLLLLLFGSIGGLIIISLWMVFFR
jgi:hypothetical protein